MTFLTATVGQRMTSQWRKNKINKNKTHKFSNKNKDKTMCLDKKSVPKMESWSFTVIVDRITEAALASNKALYVVNSATQEVHPDGKYDGYFPVRPLDINFLNNRVR